MKITLVLSLILFISNSIFGQKIEEVITNDFNSTCILQSKEAYFHHSKENVNDTLDYIVFSSVLKIRKSPDVKSDSIGRLLAGQKVTILQFTDNLFKLDGISAPWVKIKTEAGEGYVWSGAISPIWVKTPDRKIYCFSYSKIKQINDFPQLEGSLRVIKDNEIVEKHSVDLSGVEEGTALSIQLLCPPDLEGVSYILKVEHNAYACGMRSISETYAIAKDKLVRIGKGSSFNEAGQFHNKTSIILPYSSYPLTYESEYWKPDENKIFQIELHDEYDENSCTWKTNTIKTELDWLNKLKKVCDD